jgi:hypothetical protein
MCLHELLVEIEPDVHAQRVQSDAVVEQLEQRARLREADRSDPQEWL